MDYVQFGSSPLMVSRIGIGCMSMSGSYGPADDRESIATLHAAFDRGVNFLDTSAAYGEGHNHRLLREALQGRRERIVIHSKAGSTNTPDGRGGGAPDYLTRICEESVERLGVDALDVFCMSRIDPGVPVEESVGAMAALVDRGLCRYIGLSEASAESIRRGHTVHPLVSLQIEYSLFSRDPEGGNLQACREFGMSLMAYSPLGRGLLTGRYRTPDDLATGDRRARMPRFEAGNIERNAQLIDQLAQIAREKAATVPQLALAWLMAQGDDVIPIPSSKSREHLLENLAACDLVLTPEDLTRIDAIVPPGAAAGARATAGSLARLNR